MTSTTSTPSSPLCVRLASCSASPRKDHASPFPLLPSPLGWGGMAEPVIVDRVTKRFAGHTAVDALSLSVPSGLIYGLLGPNGAGTTKTIRMSMDVYEPDSGVVALFGHVHERPQHYSQIR